MKALKIIALSLAIAIGLVLIIGIAVNIFDDREPAPLQSSTSFTRGAQIQVEISHDGQPDVFIGRDDAENRSAPQLLEQLADQGSHEAMVLLGTLYWTGSDVSYNGLQILPQNRSRAVGYYQQAAELDNTDGQYYLAIALLEGKGTVANAAEGTRWLERAANAGHVDAVKALARLSGEPEQEAEFVEGAHASSTINGVTFSVLGGGNQSISALANGVEIQVDGHSVVAIGSEVTVDGQSFNAGSFDQLIIDNQGVGFQVRADTRVLFEMSAADALAQSANSNDSSALTDAAIAYYLGENGVTKDRAEAARLFTKAADLDNRVAAFNLGIMYRDGDGVAQSGEAAAKYFQKAGDLGNLDGYADLALIYWDGEIVPQDRKRAVEMARKNGGESRFANLVLGHAAFFGLGGVTKDYVSAAQWYEKSAQAGHEVAAYNVGLMYRDGDGVAVDLDIARKWLAQARDGGAEGAAKALSDLANVNQASNQASNQAPALNAPAAPSEYFYAANGQQQGPIGVSALKGQLQQGQLPPNTLVWKDGMAEWTPAKNLAELN